MNRRSFLASLIALPFVGSFWPKRTTGSWASRGWRPSRYTSGREVNLCEPYKLTEHDKAVYAKHLKDVWANPPARCIDADYVKQMGNMVDEAVFRSMKERYYL